MRVQLGTFFGKYVKFAEKTALTDGILFVDRQELHALLTKDTNIEQADVYVARPGDETRIVHVLDVLEPRFKISPQGSTFPGSLGTPGSCGEGQTHRLSGVALVSTADAEARSAEFHEAIQESIIDMAGPGAELGPFGRMANLILSLRPRGSCSIQEYENSLTLAGFRAAEYLGKATAKLKPDLVETFELVNADASLPRVVYIRVCDNDVTIYGQGTNHASFIPTLLHPNELLDGAVANIAWWAGNERNVTYTQTNDPVVKALYARHAKELNFVGVVVSGRSGRNYADKEHRARYVVKLAGLLGAQNAIISWVKGGSSQIDLMLTCQMCERSNVKTVLLVSCYGGPTGIDQPFVFTVPEATALISNGNPDATVHLPAMKRAVGGETIYETGQPALEPLVCSTRTVLGAANRMGFNCMTTGEY